jgi:hypothetical protein
MVTKAKRVMVVGLAALLLAGGGTATLDGGQAALAGSKPTGSTGDVQVQGSKPVGNTGDVAGQRKRGGDGPSAQAGSSGSINSGGEF